MSKLSSSLDTNNSKKVYVYNTAILFDWNVDSEAPFSFFDVSIFREKEMKTEWFSKNLGNNSRITQLRNLSPFPGGTFSLFGKIEVGATKKQKKDIVSTLNKKYLDLASAEGSDTKNCLRKMIESNPYRYLSLASKKSLAVENEIRLMRKKNKQLSLSLNDPTSSPSSSTSCLSSFSCSILQRNTTVVGRQSKNEKCGGTDNFADQSTLLQDHPSTLLQDPPTLFEDPLSPSILESQAPTSVQAQLPRFLILLMWMILLLLILLLDRHLLLE